MSGNVLGGNLTVNLIAVTDEFKQKMNEAGGLMKTVVGKIEANKEALRKTGLAFGAAGAAITTALGAAVKQAASTGDEFEKMSKRTGESASTLSGLAFAAERSGTSIESVENAIKRAQRNMADAAAGIGEAKGAFDELGISVTNADGSLKSGSDILLDFAAATSDMDDASRKAALAQEIFGRSGTDLLPLFAEGADGIQALTDEAERYGIVVDDVTARQGADLVDAFSNLGATIQGVALSLGSVLMPVITPVINKLADMLSKVSAFMREHAGLTKAIGLIAGAFGILATAVGGLLLGATALPALMTAFSSLGGLLAISGPVGIALVAAAGLIYALYENWDVVSAGIKTGWDEIIKPTLEFVKGAFTAVWNTVNQVGEWIWGKISGVFTSISNALTPVIDLFIDGFENTWDVVKTIFGFIWDMVSEVVQGIYDKFRWVLDKLGIELPEMEDIWGDIGDAGEEAADGIKNKWTEMKESFRGHMEANQAKHEETVAAIEAQEVALTDTVIEEQEKREASDEEQATLAKEYRAKEHAAMVQEMLAEEERRKNETISYDSTMHDEMVQDYGDMLTDEELAHAEFLRVTGGAWQAYIEEVTKPGPFETMFAGVKENFVSRIDEMGDQWIENIHTGSFADSFKFMGEYLKRTFESAIMDIEKNILKSFLDRVGEYLGGLFSGEGGLFDRLKKGLGGLISDIGGAFSSDGALATGAKSIGGTVLGTLGTAGSALASGLGTAGSAAMGAIGALGVGTLGVGAALAGIAYGISKLTGEGETKGNHGRRLAEEYVGAAYSPVSWMNWQILEKDSNSNKRSWFIENVDKMLFAAMNDPNASPEALGEEVRNWFAERYNGEYDQRGALYAGIAQETLQRVIDGDNWVLKFHTGGIVPGILGQDRLIKAYAGEEILRHDDPRHSNNIGFGGITVNITGNTISSALDIQQLGNIAATQIFDKLKLRTRITRY